MAERYPLSDLSLARRLEAAEGQSSAEYVEVQARLDPECEAEWMAVAGGYVMFAGVGSPLTQTFGLGVFDEIREEDLERVETFYRERGANVYHEISPLADPEFLALLCERGYQPIEYSSVLYRPISTDLTLEGDERSQIAVDAIGNAEAELWAHTAARGWIEFGELGDLMSEVAHICSIRENALLYLARIHGDAIAAAALTWHAGVAYLAGASTVPEARRQGAQHALLEHRLRAGAAGGCDLAMMCARPGSASQRNAERHAFRIAYTRIKWELRDPH